MFSTAGLDKWINTHHGPRIQASVLHFIAHKLDILKAFTPDEYDFDPVMEDLYTECRKKVAPTVPEKTISRWWYIFLEFGDIPDVVTKRMAELNKLAGRNNNNRALNNEELQKLKTLIDENPNLYLDEIAISFGNKTGKYLKYNTIWNYATKELGYSLKVISLRAKQRNYDEELMFLDALAKYLQGCPERLIAIDETSKGRNASRRRRGW